MQLYCKTFDGALIVIASHEESDGVATSAYGDGVIALPYTGDVPLGDLLLKQAPDRLINLTDYTAAKRYAAEISGITVTVGTEKTVPMSTKREDRDGARDTLIAVMAGLRQDGAVFKFADGVGRAATNAEMKAAIAAAFAHVQAAYDLEASIVAQIEGKNPKITDIAGVDAAFASLTA